MKRKKNLLYYFIGFVLINFCCTNANAQNQSKFEPCLNLGIRNVGLMCNYKIQKQVDFNVGVNAPRYSNFSIAMYGGLKFYPFKNSISSKIYAGRPFIGVAYSYSLKTTFSGEDSRTFVNTFIGIYA